MKQSSNHESVPAGLLLVADIVARIPERAMDFVERERQLKQLSLLSIQQMKRTYSWNPGRTVWIALLIGLTVFSTGWSLSSILGMFGTSGMSLGGAVKQYQQLGIEIPVGVAGQFSSMTGFVDAMPKITMTDTVMFTIGSIILYAIYKFITVLPNLDRLKLLREEEARIEEEISYLNGWMSDLASKASDIKNQKGE
jgi:hypothetical protein